MSDKPKRKRRTKAQIEADKLKELNTFNVVVDESSDDGITSVGLKESVDDEMKFSVVNSTPFTKADIKYLESRLDNAKRHRPSVMLNVVEIYNRVFDKNVSAYFSYDNYVKIINELKDRYENTEKA